MQRQVELRYEPMLKAPRDGYIFSGAEKRALDALRLLHRDDLLEFADCIASDRAEHRVREGRIIGLLRALADARAALDE